ncbi:hypothetical protein OH77DRAFT_62962 [Trametes cingulata]|nr:hypothetical protein OH77DRAFT_62962 [Trametes cingulata]
MLDFPCMRLRIFALPTCSECSMPPISSWVSVRARESSSAPATNLCSPGILSSGYEMKTTLTVILRGTPYA